MKRKWFFVTLEINPTGQMWLHTEWKELYQTKKLKSKQQFHTTIINNATSSEIIEKPINDFFPFVPIWPDETGLQGNNVDTFKDVSNLLPVSSCDLVMATKVRSVFYDISWTFRYISTALKYTGKMNNPSCCDREKITIALESYIFKSVFKN